MKKIIFIVMGLTSLNVLANQDKMVCGVYLFNNQGKVLAHRTMEQEMSGMSAGTINGADFYIESKKKRFLRKPLVTSKIQFTDFMNTYNREGEFVFYRQSKPNRYGIMTQKFEQIGEKIVVPVFQEKVKFISEKYAVKIYCTVTAGEN